MHGEMRTLRRTHEFEQSWLEEQDGLELADDDGVVKFVARWKRDRKRLNGLVQKSMNVIRRVDGTCGRD